MEGTTMRTHLLISAGIAAAACATILAPAAAAQATDDCAGTDRNPRGQAGFVLRDEDGKNPFAVADSRRVTLKADCSR
jgi:hypothetical protein